MYVKDGLGDMKFPVPTTPWCWIRRGALYAPRVFGIQAGQPLEILNSDETLHNIHALPMNNREFNRGQALKGLKHTHVFTTAEVMVPFKCDVHNWMNAWVGVLDHPFYAVSGPGGAFDIQRPAAGHLHHRSVAREARHADADGHDRTEGNEGAVLHVQAVSPRSEVNAPPSLRGARRALNGSPDLCRRPRHEHGFGTVGPRLAHHVRLVHVHVPAGEDGRWHSLRAHSSTHREHGRLPDPGSRRVAASGGTETMGAPAGLRRARRSRHARHPRRHHCPVVPSGSDLDCSREPGATRLLSDDLDRVDDVSWMEARVSRDADLYPTIGSCSASRRRRRASCIVQILVGATMRHTDAGLAIPDFPLAFGHLIPPSWDPKIAVHFAHRVGALVVTLFAIATTGHVFFHHRSRPELWRPSALLLVLLIAADHTRRADGVEPEALHHQLAARRDRCVRAGHVARADASNPSRQLWTGIDRVRRTGHGLRVLTNMRVRRMCDPVREGTREDEHADRRRRVGAGRRVARAASLDRIVHWISLRSPSLDSICSFW